MPYFISLNKKIREDLFFKLKKNINCTWEVLYPKLNISRAMFYNYLSGRYDMPEEIFERLQRMAKINISDYDRNFKKKYTKNEVKVPQICEDLAEIFGILNGDGHISRNGEISVVISHLEKDYSVYIKELFEKIFNLKFKKYKQKTRIKIRAYSKKLAKILNEIFGLPKGKKLGNLKIPEAIIGKEGLLKAYIRGLFDTDGSIYLRRKKDIALEIISADPDYLKEIKDALSLLGFICGISKKNLYIYRKNMIKKFFEEIKPSNSKHLKKFKAYSNLSAGGPMV